MEMLLNDGGEIVYELVVPDDLRAMLAVAVSADLDHLLEAPAQLPEDAEGVRLWSECERAMLDGLDAGEPRVRFPARGSGYLHATIVQSTVDAVRDGRLDLAQSWLTLLKEFPERDDLA